jgi:hypothetical protein
MLPVVINLHLAKRSMKSFPNRTTGHCTLLHVWVWLEEGVLGKMDQNGSVSKSRLTFSKHV